MPLDFEKVDLGGFGISEQPLEQDDHSHLKANLSEAFKINPDQAAQVRKLSRDSGVPDQAVASDPAMVEQRLKFDNIDFNKLSQRNPNTALYLTDFNNAVIAQDDLEILNILEDTLTAVGDIGRSLPSGALQGFGSAFEGSGRLLDVGARTLARGLDAVLPESFDRYIWLTEEATETERLLAQLTPQELLKYEGRGLKQVAADVGAPEDRQNLMTDIGAGVGQLASQVLAHIVNPGAAVGMMFSTGVDIQGERQEASGTEGRDLQSDLALLTGGAITAGTEKLSLDALLNRIPPKIKNDVLRQLADISIAGGIEAVQEVAEGIAQGLLEQYTTNPDAEIFEGLEREALAAGGAGAIFRALVNALTPGRVRSVQDDDAYRDTVSAAEQEKLDKIQAAADQSKLKQRDAESFRQFMQQADGGQDTQVFIDGAQAALFLQSKTRDQIQADPGLQLLQKNVREAATLGGDVTVPVADFATDIVGTETFDTLRPHMTMSADTTSPFRQEQVKAETESYITRLMAEAQENVSEYVESQQIYEQVQQQLVDTGMVSDRNAAVMAQVVPAWATAYARRNGITVAEAYQKAGLTIQGPQTGELERLSAEALSQAITPDQIDTLPENVRDMAAELIDNGGAVSNDGMVTVYHRTSADNANQIQSTGRMSGKEDGLFFSTSTGGQAEGFGDSIVALKIPLDQIQLDDVFGDEAHVRMPVKPNQPVDVSGWIIKPQQVTQDEQQLRQTGRPVPERQTGADAYAEAIGRDDQAALAEFERAQAGEQVTVVHRSRNDFDRFDDALLGEATTTPTAQLGHFTAFADVGNADRYGDVATVFRGALKNPITVDAETFAALGDRTSDEVRQMRQRFIDMGHDGILVRDLNWAIFFNGDSLARVDDTEGLDFNLFQFAGQKSETAPINTLDRAKEMASKGMGMNSIRRDTGWFMGVDGRWRYEISDDKARFFDKKGINVELDKIAPDVEFSTEDDGVVRAEYDGDLGFVIAYGNTKGDALINAQSQLIQNRAGGKFLIENASDGVRTLLDDLLYHPELFNAYPDLRRIRVAFDSSMGAKGEYNPARDEIKLDPSLSTDEMLSTVLHEIQHAIQEREDFARGGSSDPGFTQSIKNALHELKEGRAEEVEKWKWRNNWKIKTAEKAAEISRNGLMYQSAQRLIDYSKRDKPSGVFRNIRNELQWIYHDQFRKDGRTDPEAMEIQRMFYDIPKRGDKRNAFLSDMAFKGAQFLMKNIPQEQIQQFKNDTRTMNGMLKALEREASKAGKELEPLRDRQDKAARAKQVQEASVFKSPYDIYRSLAGEIEARATQARQKLTPEQRQSRSIAIDMDVPASEAIVIVGGMEIDAPTVMMSAGRTGGQARGYYDPSNSIIRLTESADLSTFLHEFAHFMYEMERNTGGETATSIDRWFKRNAESVAAEANGYTGGEFDPLKQGDTPAGPITTDDVVSYIDNRTTGDKAKDAAIRRAVHEQFARGFETYLMEGKAPSVELRNAFRTFARWLVQVYRSIRGNLKVDLDDQMRQVFDRMLATEEQIAAAEARARYEPMFSDAAMAGMTEDEFAAYQQRQQKVKDKQSETLREKLIKQLTRQTEAWWKEEKADLISQEIDILSDEPVYRARARLRDGDIKLDHATVKEMVGQQKTDSRGRTFNVIPDQLRGMTAKGQQGVHPDEAAAFFGYNSGSEMLDDLINAPKIGEVAEANAQQQMIQRHGDILTDGTIEQQADEAVQNEERGRLILDELKALSRGTNQPQLDRNTIKQLAEDRISKLAFREIHPGKYRKAEIRAAQESAAALAQGNREGAAQAKARQVLNYYLGMVATDAKNETLKIVDRMGRYNKKAVQQEIQKAEGGYWEQLVKILERFEFRKSATLRSVDQRNQDINTWAKERMEIDGDGLVLTPAVLNESYVTHWKNVPFGDLKGINDSVRNIEHVARYANKLTRMGEEIEFKKLVDRWVTSMDEKVKTRFKSKRTSVVEGRNWGRWAMAQMTKIPYMASWLDGGERAGLSHQILVQPFTDAYDAEIRLWAEAGKPVMDMIANRSKADIKRHNRKIYIPEIDDNLFGHQILAVALNTGNQSNLKKMLLGEGWANPEIEAEINFDNPKLQAVLRHMTESDWQMVQKIWGQMDTLYPQLAEVHRRTTGITPPKIEATPVVTRFGTFKGGYYPVKYDPNRSFRAQLNEEKLNAETESMFSNNASIQASVNAAATNERTGYYAPIRLSLDVVPAHFQETIHFITHHDPVREINRLLRNEQVATTIKEKLGPEEYAQLKPWLNDIAKDGRETPTKMFWDSMLQRLRFGVTLGTMGFKASTGIIQVSGLSNTIAEVGAAPVFQAMRSILGSTTTMKAAWEFAVANSKVLDHRTQTMDREIKNAMQRLEGKRGVLAAAQEVSMKHIALIQTYMVDLPSWHAAYIKGMNEWGDEARAYQYADWVVENVQGSGATKDMAKIMRGQSETGRMFTMFMTFFSSLWNMERDLVKGARSGVYSTTTVAAKAMFLFTIPVLFEMMMRGELSTPEDDEDDRLQKMLTGVAMYPLQSVPFVRDVANASLGEYGYNMTPLASVIEQGTRTIPNLVTKGFTDDEITKADVKGTTKFIGAAVGVPGVNQAWATGEHLYDVMIEGEDLTVHQLLFGPDRN